MFGLIPLLFCAFSLIVPTYLVKYSLAKLNISLGRLELSFFSIFLGQIIFASVIFLLALVIGLSWTTLAIVSASFLIAGFFVLKQEKLRFNLNLEHQEKIFLVVILCVGAALFVLLKRHMLFQTPDGFSTPHNTFGDLQYHLAIVDSFYSGSNFPPQNPIYAGVRLSYPFMIDFYSAVLRVAGFSVQNALVIPGLIFGICFFAFFILFAFRFLKTKAGAVIALIIFIFNGGMGGYLTIKESLPLPNFFQNLPGNFSSVIDKYNFRFPNGFSSVFMAERPILVGMASFFAILILLWVSFQKLRADKEILLAGLIIGILPLWHTHTIIALGLTLPFYFIAYWIYNKAAFIKVFRFFLPILILSVPLGTIGMLWHLPQVLAGGVHFFSFKTGWIVGSEGFWVFWFRNLGIFPLLLLISFFLLDKKQKLFYIPLFLIFVFANFIQFQPFDWDNYKILLIWYAVSSIIVSGFILMLFTRMKTFGKVFATVILSFLVLSGMVLILGDYLTFYGLFSNEDIELSNWEIQNTNPRDLILTGPQHNQFSILAGRKILMGYPGYLWTQGIDSSQREGDIRKMYYGDMTLIKKYNIKYIVLGYEEKKDYNPDTKFLDAFFPLVKQTNNFKIYKVL